MYYPLITRKTARKTFRLSLRRVRTICSIHSRFSHLWHYLMPNRDFKVKIMASDRRKCKHDLEVFCYICGCFTTSKQGQNILQKNFVFVEKNYRFCKKKLFMKSSLTLTGVFTNIFVHSFKDNQFFWILRFVIKTETFDIWWLLKNLHSYFVKKTVIESDYIFYLSIIELGTFRPLQIIRFPPPPE